MQIYNKDKQGFMRNKRFDEESLKLILINEQRKHERDACDMRSFWKLEKDFFKHQRRILLNEQIFWCCLMEIPWIGNFRNTKTRKPQDLFHLHKMFASYHKGQVNLGFGLSLPLDFCWSSSTHHPVIGNGRHYC